MMIAGATFLAELYSGFFQNISETLTVRWSMGYGWWLIPGAVAGGFCWYWIIKGLVKLAALVLPG